jgi:hypothetical protein
VVGEQMMNTMNRSSAAARPIVAALAALAVLAALVPLAAQTQKELIRLRAAMLESRFLEAGGWVTDLDAAKARAAKSGKLILAYFTRSSSIPPPCAELQQGVLASPEFAALGDEVVLFCHVTSGVEGDKDQDLLARLGGRAFPFFIGLDEAGRPIARFAYPQTLAGLTRFVAGDLKEYAELRAKAGKGDKPAMAALLMHRIEFGHLQPAELQKVLQSADYLTKAQRAVIERGLIRLEIREILARIDGDDPDSVVRAAERMLVMKEAGRIPTGREGHMFWQIILGHADKTEDPALFREVLDRIQQLPGDPPPRKWLSRMQNRLKALEFMKKAPPRKRK